MTSMVSHPAIAPLGQGPMTQYDDPQNEPAILDRQHAQHKKSPGVDSNENNIDSHHRSPDEVLGLPSSPFAGSTPGTPTGAAELAADPAQGHGHAHSLAHIYPVAAPPYTVNEYGLATKHEPSASPECYGRPYAESVPHAPLTLEPPATHAQPSDEQLLYPGAAPAGYEALEHDSAAASAASAASSDALTHEYLKSLSMQAYGAQPSPAACLQAPSVYNSMYNMYGAAHTGARAQQRSGGLSQNYLSSYGGGLSSGGAASQAAYMPAAYNYGGGASLPSAGLNQTYSTAQQVSHQVAAEYGSYGYGPQAFAYYGAAAGFGPYMSPTGSSGSHPGLSAAGSGGGGGAAQTYHLSPLPIVTSPDGSDFSESSSLLYHSPTLSSGRRRRNSNGSSGGSSRSRRRRGEPSPDDELAQKIDRIFIWDLDETIIVFHSLLTGQYARENGKDQAVCSQIGSNLETLVFTTGEELFFLKELDVDTQYPTHVMNIDDLHAEDNNQDLSNYNFLADGLASSLGVPAAPLGYSMARNNVSADLARKIAFRHRRVKELYNMYRNNVAELFRMHLHGRHPNFELTWTKTRQELERETNGWLTQACSCLKLIQERKQCTNVMVTRNMLMTTFAKTVVFGLADCFEPENIFSAFKHGFSNCLATIRQKYTEKHGRDVICVIIGKPDKPESPSIITAARQDGMPYFPINSERDLLALKFFLQCGYM